MDEHDSTWSASARTTTDAALVCTRPLVSVAGTRCTRWMPDSHFRAPYTLFPAHSQHPVATGPSMKQSFSRPQSQHTNCYPKLTCNSRAAVLAAARLRQRQVHDLEAPAPQGCKLLVHAPEILCKERCLFSAGAGPHLCTE